ncbi:hypothetical protein [Devriesea agamarum]|uniref:hypothetical protein n=1 Tax=Devriesea agamarum TaxID=472569 RepID=UPI0012ECC1E3|nr:hypothetical protein [Devriesea agamarum]
MSRIDGPQILGHEWGEDAGDDLWVLCYQFFTDPNSYDTMSMLRPTELAGVILKEHSSMLVGRAQNEGLPQDEVTSPQLYGNPHHGDEALRPGHGIPCEGNAQLKQSYMAPLTPVVDDSWLFGRVAQYRQRPEYIFVPVIPLQEVSRATPNKFSGFQFIDIENAHGPHSFFRMRFRGEVTYVAPDLSGFILRKNAVYAVYHWDEYMVAGPRRSVRQYVIKDSEKTISFMAPPSYLTEPWIGQTGRSQYIVQ